MKELIMQIIERRYGVVRKTRSRLELAKIEKAVISTYEYASDYVIADGFSLFQAGIKELVAEGYLTVLSRPKQYKTSSLNEFYWLPETASTVAGWNEASMLRVMDAKPLNLTFYRNHPEEQTAQVWEYVERIYHFLRTAGDREIITREERSLELFDDEKFLSEKVGIQLLTRLGITLETIKAAKVREIFEFHEGPLRPIQNILISENHSFYDSAKRLMIKGQTISGLQPDMLIYGEGWKIVSSLFFLKEENIDPHGVNIYYVGDMDKTGWDIYGTLKLSYPDWNIMLALPIYKCMIENAKQSYRYSNKQKDCLPLHLEIILQETDVIPELKLFIERLLEADKRLPQEVLNYEVMARLA